MFKNLIFHFSFIFLPTAEKAMAPHSSTLAWTIPWMEETGRLQSMGSLGVRQDWAPSLSLFTFMHWRKKWQPAPVLLPGESQGQEAWWVAVYGVTQSQTRLKWLSSSSSRVVVIQLLSHVQLCNTPGFPVLHHLPEFEQTHVHWVGDAIQPFCPLSSPSPPAFNLSQHQGLFQWVSSLYQLAKVLGFQLQHQSFQWIFRIDFL